jgi:hypothetical protein
MSANDYLMGLNKVIESFQEDATTNLYLTEVTEVCPRVFSHYEVTKCMTPF